MGKIKAIISEKEAARRIKEILGRGIEERVGGKTFKEVVEEVKRSGGVSPPNLERLERARIAREQELARQQEIERRKKAEQERVRRIAEDKAIAEQRKRDREAATRRIRDRAIREKVSFEIAAIRERADQIEVLRKEAKRRGIDISTRARQIGFIQKLRREAQFPPRRKAIPPPPPTKTKKNNIKTQSLCYWKRT